MQEIKANIENFSSEDRFFNRELSWLEFNHRVLLQARNKDFPLLERLTFLSISDRNLDEFYMVRVSGKKRKLWSGRNKASFDGLTVKEQLEKINTRVREMVSLQYEIWQELEEELNNKGISFVDDLKALSMEEYEWLEDYYEERIFPLLSPSSIEDASSMPSISNDSFALALRLQKNEGLLNVIIPQPKNTPRFINLLEQDTQFVPLEVLIKHFFYKLFPSYIIEEDALFHIIRDSDIKIISDVEFDDEDELVEFYKDQIEARKYGDVIRLFTRQDSSEDFLDFISSTLHLEEEDIFHVDGLMNYSELSELRKINRPELMFDHFEPKLPGFDKTDLYKVLKEKDLIFHHPYDSYNPIVAFIEQAAADPDVISIKQTLYRTNYNSPIVQALSEAAQRGKSVAAVIELKARFDEENNILLSEKLEAAGVHVNYGFIKKKTHSKICVVTKKEGEKNQYYTHIGTGNYNPVTARLYTDLSLLTSDRQVGKDALKIFNYLTASVEPAELKDLYITPINMEQEIKTLIDQEIDNAKAGKPAQIWAKINSLQDPNLVDHLYLASQAGVKIDLIVRGICVLKPGVKGLSENINVKSIVGRFLEHSRLFIFANGDALPSSQAKVFISSSDWMQRSFQRRVELMISIEDKWVKDRIVSEIFPGYLNDVYGSWELTDNNSYFKSSGSDYSSQADFMKEDKNDT